MKSLHKCVIAACLCSLIIGCPGVIPPPGGNGNGDGNSEPTGRERFTQQDIDTGKISLRDLLFKGRNLAIRNWQLDDGWGNARNGAIAPNLNRMPGPDSSSCMSCHGLGNGVVLGWGDNAANVLVTLDSPTNPTVGGSDERNTPAEHGLSLLELLGKEISHELQAIRADAVAEAAASGNDVTKTLISKGVSYGTITAHADGSLDTSGVIGIDSDLYVRPFHAKGHEATIRIFTRNALNRHHGIQATEFLMTKDATKDPETWDEDQDGVVNEINEGELTAITAFQVCLPIPQEVDQDKPSIAHGRELMTTMGCTECHLPTLTLNNATWRYTSSAGVTTSIDMTDASMLGAGRPIKEADGSVNVQLWGDLKRHDVGPESHEPLDQPVELSKPDYEPDSFGKKLNETLPPIPKELMLTTELWGLRDTGPWWHDGTSPTIDDAILRHGGESQASRDAYAALSEADEADLFAFLNSLQVAQVGEILNTADPGSNAPGPIASMSP